MKTINTILICLLIINGTNIAAQIYEPPKNYKFVDAIDYEEYEADVINAANWLLRTPPNEEIEKRNEVTEFVVTWIKGSPTVTVELDQIFLDFDSKNAGMLVLFMASSAKYVLENNYSNDIRAKHKGALQDLITVYKAGNGIKKDKKMEELIKSNQEGKLDEWLDENLKINN